MTSAATIPPPSTVEPGSRTDDELLALLRSEGDRLSRTVIDELARRADRLIPRLAELLRDEAAWDGDEPAWWAVVHGTFALSATGRPEAVPHLLDALRRADDRGVDWINDVGGVLFQRIGRGAFEQVRTVFLDPEEPPFVRWSALDAMAALSLAHEDLQPRVIRDAAAALAARPPYEVVEAIESVLLSYAALGRRPEIVEALGARETPEWLLEQVRDPFPHHRRDPLSFYDPEEIAARQGRWAREAELERAIAERRAQAQAQAGFAQAPPEPPPPPEPVVPFVREAPKVGRNDPCRCGSGKKLKRCCGR
jgi:hypothetical protein